MNYAWDTWLWMRFLTYFDLLHYVPYIKEEKVKIQQFLECLPPSFLDRIEFDMPKNLDTMLHKARLYYEHGQLRQENMNQSYDSLQGDFRKIRASTYEGEVKTGEKAEELLLGMIK